MSSAPRNPPFRAEHLGSLLRPSKLLNKRHAIQQKKDSEEGLVQLEDESIREIVQIQTDCGFRAISDGEYRRHMFWVRNTQTLTWSEARERGELTAGAQGTFFPSLNGMKEIYNPELSIFRLYVPDIAAFVEEEKVPGESVICVSKISHPGESSYIGQFEYLKSITPKERHGDIKMTLAAPNWYHLRYKEGKAYPKEVYSSDEEYFADIAEAYRTELKILYDAGLRNAQVDDPNLACESRFLERDVWCWSELLTGTHRLLLRQDDRRMEAGYRKHALDRRPLRCVHQLLQRVLQAPERHASWHPPVPWQLRQFAPLLRRYDMAWTFRPDLIAEVLQAVTTASRESSSRSSTPTRTTSSTTPRAPAASSR